MDKEAIKDVKLGFIVRVTINGKFNVPIAMRRALHIKHGDYLKVVIEKL